MKTETINNILEVGTNLILKKGFNNVGIQEILKEAKIPKGSFYYYFESKEDFGIRLIKYYSQNSIGILNSYLQNKSKLPKERILFFFRDMKNVYAEKQFTEGCLLGNCSLELSDISESFSSVISSELDEWQMCFERCVLEGQKTGNIKTERPAKEVANFLLTSWEGALLRMKSSKSGESIEVFINFIDAYIL